jgi:hypothetical protein
METPKLSPKLESNLKSMENSLGISLKGKKINYPYIGEGIIAGAQGGEILWFSELKQLLSFPVEEISMYLVEDVEVIKNEIKKNDKVFVAEREGVVKEVYKDGFKSGVYAPMDLMCQRWYLVEYGDTIGVFPESQLTKKV